MAESEILRGGRWEPRRFSATGAVHVAVMGPRDSRLQLEVERLQSQLRRQSPSDGAFPLSGAADGVTIVATAADGEAFPGGAMADLSLSFPAARRDYLVEQIDISGRRSAPLVRLREEDGQWILAPAEVDSAVPGPVPPLPGSIPAAAVGGGRAAAASKSTAGPVSEADIGGNSVPELLGAWIGRRRRDAGTAVAPAVSEIRVDRSVSMEKHALRVDILRDFLRSLARTGGSTVPAVVDAAVGGAARHGVGSVALSSHSGGQTGRSLVITDIPVGQRGVANLVLGEAEILEILATEDAFAITPEIWQELEREDASFDDSTLRRLEPLVEWLTGGVTTVEVRS